MVERDDEIKVLGEINLELQSGTHKVIEKLSQEKVSQEEALEKFKWKVERNHEIKVLGEVNVELESGTKKLREKLSQEEDSEEEDLEEFNLTLDNILEKLSQEKDSPDDFYGFMYDTNDDASISGKSDFFVGLDQPIHVVVVQNTVHEEVAEEVEERRPIKRIIVIQEEMVKDENPKKG
ncbi:hypothetical protein Tco_0988519 [Tanacetum coccineum]|uniref:Uncharacterized protein n=1 Tax=Tanacetum coccineum TaxID=301880 RepID=A0ABQ5ERB1_9ASTR